MKTWRWMLVMLSIGAIGAACTVESKKKDDDDSTGGTGGTTSSNTGTGTGTTTGTSSSTGTGGGSCYDETLALQAPGTTVVVGTNHCTTTQVDDFFTACFGAAATQTTCMDFDTANTDCVDCILGNDPANGTQDNSVPVMLIGNSTAQGSTAYLSYYACESAAQGLPQCAVPITSLVFCANTACENCMAGSADETACLTEAENGVCSTITIPTECDPVVNADPASAQCDGTDFQGLYTNMANYMCGAP